MTNVTFKPYRSADKQACINIFDANSPEFFSPNERQKYGMFLDDKPQAYEVCEVDGHIRGAFGLFDNGATEMRLNWILLDPSIKDLGIGSKIMGRVIQQALLSASRQINIAASQKSAPFFARFGAKITTTTVDGWGIGMDRVDMILQLDGTPPG